MRLSEYLQQKNISAAEFGRRIGLSRSGVLRLCSGERSPSMRVLALIAAATENAVGLSDFVEHKATLASDRLGASGEAA